MSTNHYRYIWQSLPAEVALYRKGCLEAGETHLQHEFGITGPQQLLGMGLEAAKGPNVHIS